MTAIKRLGGVFLFAVAAAMAYGQGDLDRLTVVQPFKAERSSSANNDLAKNGDARPIPAGETLVLADLEGPGVVNHIWCTIGSPDPFHGRSHVLRVYYDGNERPSVEAPLGDFFGVGHGAMADYSSAVANVSSFGRSRSCYWRMPFKNRIKITVTNESTTLSTDSFYFYVDWEKHAALPEETLYFHAQYRQENPTEAGDYTVLETTGKGHFAGMVYSALQAETGWFGEGDDRFYVDGETTPSLSGTGTEDYFNDAWGFRAFNTPYYGVSLWEGYGAGDRVTAYRWHVPDPVPFTKSLRVDMETRGSVFTPSGQHLGQFLHRRDFISSVAFWYQWPPKLIEGSLPPVQDRIPPYVIMPGESLVVEAKPETGLLKETPSVLYIPGQPDAEIAFTFTAPADGHYQISAIMGYGFQGGLYQPSLNGQPIGGPIDFWIEGMDPVWTRLDTHEFKAGEKQTLTFTGQGPSPHARSSYGPRHGLALHYLVLLRLENLPGYHVALNELAPTVPAAPEKPAPPEREIKEPRQPQPRRGAQAR